MIYNIGKTDFSVNSVTNPASTKAAVTGESHVENLSTCWLGKNVKIIWDGDWKDTKDGATQQVRLNELFQVCNDAKCKHKLHTSAQINLTTKVEELGDVKKHIFFALDGDVYNQPLEDLTIDRLQDLVKQLNQRLHFIWCQILINNAQNLDEFKPWGNGGVFIKADAYGKINAKQNKHVVIAMFESGENRPGTITQKLKENVQQKAGRGPQKTVSALKRQIFFQVLELTKQMWDQRVQSSAAPSFIQTQTSQGEQISDSWIKPLTEILYYSLCSGKRLRTKEELSTISTNLQQHIEAAIAQATQEDSSQKINLSEQISQMFDDINKNAQKAEQEIIDRAQQNIIDKALQEINEKAIEYKKQFFAVVYQITMRVWETEKSVQAKTQVVEKRSATPLKKRPHSPPSTPKLTSRISSVGLGWDQSTELVRKSSTDSNSNSISSFMSSSSASAMSQTVGHSMVLAEELILIEPRVYDYYETILEGFRGIDGHGKKVRIQVKNLQMSAEWEQGKGRVFSCSVDLANTSDIKPTKQTIEEAVAYLIALAIAGHTMDPAYEKLMTTNANVIQEIGTLRQMTSTFLGHYIGHPIFNTISDEQDKLTEKYQELRAPSAVPCAVQRSLATLLTFMFTHRRELSKLNDFNWTVFTNFKRKLKKKEDSTAGQKMSALQRNLELNRNMGLDVEEERGINISSRPKSMIKKTRHSEDIDDEESEGKNISELLNYVFVEILKAISKEYSFHPNDCLMVIDAWFYAARATSLKDTTLEAFATSTHAYISSRKGLLGVSVSEVWSKVDVRLKGNSKPSSASDSFVDSTSTNSKKEYSRSDEKRDYDEKRDI